MLDSWTTQRILALEFDWGNTKTQFQNLVRTLNDLRGDGAWNKEYRETLGIKFYGFSKSCPCGCDKFRVGSYYRDFVESQKKQEATK